MLALVLGKFRPPSLYTGTVIATFVLYNLILTWHAFGARIQLSLFLLVAPVCGLFIASIRSEALRKALLSLFCLIALQPLFMCESRALFSKNMLHNIPNSIQHFMASSREELLFNEYPGLREEYIRSVKYIADKKPGIVGVKIGNNGLEYPLWAILHKYLGDNMPKIVSILPEVENLPLYLREHWKDNIPTLESAFKGKTEKPVYILDAERNDQNEMTYSPRVLKYENGETKIVFNGQRTN